MNISNFKLIYVLLDGIGDLPHPLLGNSTPLQVARTPNLDILASNGCMGNVISVGKGIAPQSDIAVFNMLGYSFKDDSYVGRGVIESIGCNIDFREGDLAMRGNFATVDDNLKIIDRRAGRVISIEEAKSVCKTLSDNIRITNTDAAYDKVGGMGIAKAVTTEDIYVQQSKAEEDTEPAKVAARMLNEFT